MEKNLKKQQELEKKLRKKILNKEKLDIFEIAFANILIKKYEWNPKLYQSSKSREEKLQKIFKNKKTSQLKSKIEKEVMKSIINKSKDDVVLVDKKSHLILLSLKELSIVYIDRKREIRYTKYFTFDELNLF